MGNNAQTQDSTPGQDYAAYTLRIPAETVKILHQYRKDKTIEEFMVKIITQDANRRK
jgi:hypothetical protein